ncbi:MAG: M1 family metallopeptidase [Cytophagales bacterium]
MKIKFLVSLALVCSTMLLAQEGSEKKKRSWFKKKKPQIPVWVASKGVYHGEETKFFDLIHTKLEVNLDFAAKQLIGKATLKLKPHFYAQDTLVLDAKGFDVYYINITTKNKFYSPTYTYDKKQLKINLGTSLSAKDTFWVSVHYKANPENLPKSGSQAISEDKGLYFINNDGKDTSKPTQVWTQGETEASSCWFPTIDKPNQKTTQEIYITVPAKYTTLSNGLFQSSTNNADGTRTDYWFQKDPHAPYLFMMAIGEFEVYKDKWRDIEVNYLMEKEFAQYAPKIFGHTPEMLEFFSNKLGVKYPWAKYSQVVVRDFVSGAMENTSASLFYEALNVTDRQLLDRNWDGIIAHELFHHWFGDLVTCESWSNLPLNESFANYSEYLWNEYKYGKDEADFNLLNEMDDYLDESKTHQEPLIRYHYFDKEDMFDNHSYNKGGCTLHMLRNIVGDDAFFKSLQLYLTKNAFKPAEIEHLRLAFEEVTGKDMHWFFDKFFMKPGHIQLGVSQSYSNGKLKIAIAQMQDSLYTPIYQLPIQIEIWANGISQVKNVVLSKALDVFEFDYTSSPELVLVDAKQTLLGEIFHKKSTKEYIFQYMHSKSYRARYVAAVALAELSAKDTLAENAMLQILSDPHNSLRELAISVLQKSKRISPEILKSKFSNIAQNDKTPRTKAVATKALAPYATSYESLLKSNLNDSAYSVVGAALHSYMYTNATDKLQVLNSFKNEKYLPILVSVSDYYIRTRDTAQQTWFDTNLQTLQRREQYHFTNQYVKYYTELGLLKSNKVIENLKNVAISKSTFIWSKLNAFNKIADVKDLKNKREVLQSIRDVETNAKLQKEYDAVINKLK